MTFIVVLILAYILCSVPCGVIISLIYGINIQKFGSGSTGGTNVSRALGLPAGIVVGLLDIFKGSIATSIAILSLNDHLLIGCVILAVVAGHIFSLFLKGKG